MLSMCSIFCQVYLLDTDLKWTDKRGSVPNSCSDSTAPLVCPRVASRYHHEVTERKMWLCLSPSWALLLKLVLQFPTPSSPLLRS